MALPIIFKHFTKKKNDNLPPFLLSLVSGLMVFYALYFLGAYNIKQSLSCSGHSLLFRCLSFGILTFSYIIILELWFKPELKLKTTKYSILWYTTLILLGSFLIFILFNIFWNWKEWNIIAYGLILKEFALIMILPITFYSSIIKSPKSPTSNTIYLSFQSTNGKDNLKIKVDHFLYANSSGNYVSIYYLSENKTKIHLIRTPLKTLEEDLKIHSEITRIHRSYIVNKVHIENIRQVKGKVFIEILDFSLPVSNTYQTHFIN